MTTPQTALETRHINFSGKFPCRRDYLASFLTAGRRFGNDRSAIMESVGYGRNFYDGFRGWATACRLWDPSRARLTELGERLLDHDPGLTDLGSAWILHAVLCADNSFWQWLFGGFLPPRELFDVKGTVSAAEASGLLLSRGLHPYAGAIIATYHKAEALGPLRILVKERGNRVRVAWEQEPPLAVYAWALYRYVRRRMGGQSQEVSLHDLLRDASGPCVAFFPDPGRAEAALEALSREGLVSLRRYARPYTLAVEISNEEQLWTAMYG